jgi:phage N-6-adenine-methyltransferase|tara:strand:- start:58 stop:567 length:510 start_codon:yes stop_codon:yes gene_type:complete
MTSTALKVLTATTGNRKDTWNTPTNFVGDVLKFFGTVDLDPCCNDVDNPNVPALNYFTEETNGLAHDWHGKVFMNHPYSDSKTWVPYAALQYESGNAEEMVLLIKLDISTKWWRSVAKYPWIAINKRLRFGVGTGAAPFQSAIVYLGKDLDRFTKVFGKYGFLYKRGDI